nr:4Fe-4S dicluster domain-containing protein [Angustibacter aerolatus]
MLDFSTCTECGRCQSQCPAWNTDKPLSPKPARDGAARPRPRQGPVPAGARRLREVRPHRPDGGRRAGPARRRRRPEPRPGRRHRLRPGRRPARRVQRGRRGHRPRRPVVVHHLRRVRRAVPGRHRARRPRRRHAALPGAHRVGVPQRA